MSSTLAEHVAAQHAQEKAIVGFESQVARGDEAIARLDASAGSGRDRTAAGGRGRADRGRAPGRRGAAITEYEAQQEGAEGRLERRDGPVARRARRSREPSCAWSPNRGPSRRRSASARPRSISKCSASRPPPRDLDERLAQRQAEIARNETRSEELRLSIQETGRLLDEDIRVIDGLKQRPPGVRRTRHRAARSVRRARAGDSRRTAGPRDASGPRSRSRKSRERPRPPTSRTSPRRARRRSTSRSTTCWPKWTGWSATASSSHPRSASPRSRPRTTTSSGRKRISACDVSGRRHLADAGTRESENPEPLEPGTPEPGTPEPRTPEPFVRRGDRRRPAPQDREARARST